MKLPNENRYLWTELAQFIATEESNYTNITIENLDNYNEYMLVASIYEENYPNDNRVLNSIIIPKDNFFIVRTRSGGQHQVEYENGTFLVGINYLGSNKIQLLAKYSSSSISKAILYAR